MWRAFTLFERSNLRLEGYQCLLPQTSSLVYAYQEVNLHVYIETSTSDAERECGQQSAIGNLERSVLDRGWSIGVHGL